MQFLFMYLCFILNMQIKTRQVGMNQVELKFL